MRRLARRTIVSAGLFGVLLALTTPKLAWTHGGGLDRYGCHHNRKAGGYHCHRGPLTGQAFASQSEMLQRLNSAPEAAEPRRPEPKRTPKSSRERCIEEEGTGRIVCGRPVD